MLRVIGLSLLAVTLACQRHDPVRGAPLFEVGSSGDPIMQMALSNATYNTLQITINNNTAFDFNEGLASTTALFTVGQVASTGLLGYTRAPSADLGDAITLAKKLGLVMGSNAFYVPAVPKGKSATFVVHVPPPMSGQLSMVMHVDGSIDDFVGFAMTAMTTLANGVTIKGFDPDDNGNKIVADNGTVGASPAVTTSRVDLTSCSGTMTSAVQLLNTSFTAGAWNHTWPWMIGFDGDFNGDWFTDGTTARMTDPKITPPIISGFAKFFYVCPASNATVSVTADVAMLSKKQDSDTTLVIYFFDSQNKIISHAENFPLHGKNYRKHALYDAVIPAGTRKIAVVPVGYFAAGETDSPHYYNLTVNYEPAGAVTTTPLASDDFSSYDLNKTPTGWTDFGGDWFVHPSYNHATVWNTNWENPKPLNVPPLDTGMQKTYALGTVTASTKLSARLFAASTFTDPASFVQLRLRFNTGQEVTASQLANSAWANLDVRRTAIPSGATSVTVTIQTYLGPSEQSSVYVDNLSLWKVQ